MVLEYSRPIFQQSSTDVVSQSIKDKYFAALNKTNFNINK